MHDSYKIFDHFLIIFLSTRSEKEDEIEAYYKKKYAETSTSRYADEEDLPDAITQQGLLPGVK